MNDVLSALLGPVATGVIATLGFWIKDARLRRDLEQRRRRALDHALKEVALIEAWLGVYGKLNPIGLPNDTRERACRDLERAYQVLASPTVTESREVDFHVRRPFWIRVFLRDITRPLARVVRGFYYFSLIAALIWSTAGFATLGEEGVSVANIFLSVIVASIGLPPALALAALARRIDKRAGHDSDATPAHR